MTSAATANRLRDVVLVAEREDGTNGIVPKRSALCIGKMFMIHSTLIVRRLAELHPNKLARVLTNAAVLTESSASDRTSGT